MLDRVYGIPHSLVELRSLSRVDLSRFTVLVFPDDESEEGSGKGYSENLDSTAVARIRDWIEEGGVFVGMGGGAVFATAGKGGLCSVKLKERKKEEQAEENPFLTVKEKKDRKMREKIPGTIFRVKLDPTHPLAFGYGDEVRILKTTTVALQPTRKGNNVAYFPPRARISGFVAEKNEEFLAGTPFLVEERVGKGHVVLYLDDPNFRLFWYGLNRLFLNSIFFISGN